MADRRAAAEYVISLFVSGQSARTNDAIATVQATLERRLPGRYSLEVIDVHAEPSRVVRDRVMATPTLVKRHPEPARRTVGALPPARVVRGLDLADDPVE
jgi:circadian clock protein KaiB